MIGLPEAKWEEKEMGIQKQEEQYPPLVSLPSIPLFASNTTTISFI
jgi:hypothetical protein